MDYKEMLKQLPPPPEGSTFKLLKVDIVGYQPHPYTIGTRHVVEAADHWSGMLTTAAIEAAERKGVRCAHPRCDVPYKRHTVETGIFIGVPQNDDLNAVEGLHTYLLALKPKAEELGIGGFAFPTL